MSLLLCPLDQLPLTLEARSYRCPRGHCFDLAKQGYVNLLPVQDKRSKAPGDSKAMVRARQDFLNAGWYQGMRDWFVAHLVESCRSVDAPVVLDAGCGEGYYTDALHKAFAAEGKTAEVYGVDISKWALMAAGKRSDAIHWVVGSNRKLPLPDASVDLLFCAFGFYSLSEFARVLKPGGKLALLDPDEAHLLALRELIYPEVRRSGVPVLEGLETAGLIESGKPRVYRENTGLMDALAIEALLAMTPHLYRAPSEGVAKARALTALDCQIDVRLRFLVRRSP